MNTPRSLFTVLLLSAAAASAALGQNFTEKREGNAWVRTVMHDDGSRTVSKKDDTVKEIEKWTLSPSDVLMSRSIFQVDREGKFQRGQVFDGAGTLRFVSEFFYDTMGRQIEERISDARGILVRRLIYSHDEFGRAKPFSISYREGSASSPVAVRNAENYSSTNDHGFQLNPNTEGRAPAPAESTARVKDETTSRAGIFRSSAKKSFRNPKRR